MTMTMTVTSADMANLLDSGDAATRNPVLFWNAVSLDLVALDHSIPAADARAPGPCASARALGAAHMVMADAARLAYPPTRYEPLRKASGPAGPISEPALFVGGAVAAILRHI